ncbi:response regulator [Blastopirellula sp. JC732]|uniref:Response regulator n=1 Tax=Blastopirellula sediminis TaxID=2894196 RepID=A0A9X1MPI8_9BACT|nr:response regulator [Blastopirellula sediminis]MCC9606341.1 response regulator [Blastopirellula sediminis]MCC9630361.1 response regulator [Blastopirellula sediminis]
MNQQKFVYVLDDDAEARASLATVVQSLGYPALEYESAEAFLEQFEPNRRGCVVADVRMGGISGVELVHRLQEQDLNLPVVVVTGFADIRLAVSAMQAGAVTFLEKVGRPGEIADAIEKAMEHEEIRHEAVSERDDYRSRIDSLSADERDVLLRVLDGKPNKVIKKELDIGLRTAELRRANVMRKMGARSLAELVRMTLVAGLAPPALEMSELPQQQEQSKAS